MMIVRPATLAALAALALSNVQAADNAVDHAAHHSAAQTAALGAPEATHKVAKSKPAASEADMAMDRQMAAMHDMHEKMMAAKTPEERQAMMGEHMKMMQDSMAMMGAMRKSGGGGASMEGMEKSKEGGMSGGMMSGMRMHHESMEKRLDMMESMMQMMMDRVAAPADK